MREAKRERLLIGASPRPSMWRLVAYRYRATIGRYPDRRIDEIFLTNHKAGSQAGSWQVMPLSWRVLPSNTAFLST
jgi:hypothetical protein